LLGFGGKRLGLYAVLLAVNPEGQLFASAPAAPGPVNYADRPWFQKISQARNLAIGETVVGRISGKVGNNLAYPILDGAGRLQGVLTTQLDVDWLGGLLAKSDFPPTTAMVLTDSSRQVLFRYPEPQKYIGEMLPDVLIKPMASSDEGVASGVGLPGDARLFAFARLSLPWPVAASCWCGYRSRNG
jgi:C4-dicarboxylate-specific signal transduction histidine kinase